MKMTLPVFVETTILISRRPASTPRLFILTILFASITLYSQAQVTPDDEMEASSLAKKYKDDNVVCRSS